MYSSSSAFLITTAVELCRMSIPVFLLQDISIAKIATQHKGSYWANPELRNKLPKTVLGSNLAMVVR
jgi:hypothetical protein